MAHIPNPDFMLDLEHIEGTSSQNIPPDLAESLHLITKLKPDRGKIAYLHIRKATFTVWGKNETRQEKLHDIDWTNRQIPVQDQKNHKSCWSSAGSENVSEARYLHGVDMQYSPYSGQYLMDFADLERAKERLDTTKGKTLNSVEIY